MDGAGARWARREPAAPRLTEVARAVQVVS